MMEIYFVNLKTYREGKISLMHSLHCNKCSREGQPGGKGIVLEEMQGDDNRQLLSVPV